MIKKTILLITVTFIFLLLSITVSADSYALWCLKKGETVNLGQLCNPKMGSRTGPIQLCMRLYDNGKICSQLPNICNRLKLGCSTASNTSFDLDPPNIFVNSPVNYTYYSSRAVLVDIDVNERSSIYYIDNINGRGRWSRLCSNCLGYSRSLSFQEGINNITIRATDSLGNSAYKDLIFFVDSLEPRIYGTTPEDGEYGNGTFIIKYTEAALKNITLYYNKDGTWKTEVKKCEPGSKQTCVFNVGGLEGEFSLDYYFGVTDSAQTVYSPEVHINIDTIAPTLEITSPHNPTLIYNNGKVLMSMSVNEPCDLNYIDYNDRRPKYKLLCKRCISYSKTKSFKDGYHNVTIRATDKAGNEDTYNLIFLIDSKKPVIKRTLPISNGYGNGTFTITYDEFNTKNVTLFYKQNLTDPYTLVVKYDCPSGRNVQCTLNANGIKQGKLYYHFSVGDVAGWNTIQVKETTVTIDTINPILNLSRPTNTIYDTTRIWFTANTSEEVALEYMNNHGSTPTWKRLCTKCSYYDMYKSFSYGDYDLTVRGRDGGGNSDEENVLFSVVRS